MLPLQETYHKPLIVDILMVLGIGILMVLSLMVLYGTAGPVVMEAQAKRFLLGWLVFCGVLLVPRDWMVFFSPALYLLSVLLLILVYFWGVSINNSQRWLNLGVQIQPSELSKLAVPLMLAYLFRHTYLQLSWGKLFLASLIIAAPSLLIFAQPDLGTAILVSSAGLALLFYAGLSWRLMGFSMLLLAIATPLFWLYGIKDYQRDRVMTLLNPEADPFGKGYHIIQSKIAIGSGGLSGKGFMHGTQSQLEFLPEQTTDFIFAVYAEEFGFIGVGLLFLLYFFILWRLFSLSYRVRDNFSRLLCAALTFIFFIYFFVNVGMVMGIFPVVGLPLPLLSFGGTSILSIMLIFGVVNRLAREDALKRLQRQSYGGFFD